MMITKSKSKLLKILGNQHFYSVSNNNLNKQQLQVQKVQEVQVPNTKEVIINNSSITTNNTKEVANILEHPLFKKLQCKTFETGSKLTSFARGPLRSNLLVSFELLKLISAEQRLIPDLSTWPQAKASYRLAYRTAKDYWLQGRINWKNFREAMGEVTWGQVGRAARITIEMASFYYIGELIGMLISLPFK